MPRYAETIDVVYGRNAFNFDYCRDLGRESTTSRLLLPQRLEAITHFDMKYYVFTDRWGLCVGTRFENALPRLPNLQVLRLSVYGPQARPSRGEGSSYDVEADANRELVFRDADALAVNGGPRLREFHLAIPADAFDSWAVGEEVVPYGSRDSAFWRPVYSWFPASGFEGYWVIRGREVPLGSGREAGPS